MIRWSQVQVLVGPPIFPFSVNNLRSRRGRLYSPCRVRVQGFSRNLYNTHPVRVSVFSTLFCSYQS